MAFSGLGAGTVGDPYQIVTPSHYRQMDNYGSSVYFKLMNDINMSGIDAYIENFSSKLDGDGHKVYNLVLNFNFNIFLFYILDGAEFHNIKFYYSSTGTGNIGFITQTAQRNNIVIDNVHIVSNLNIQAILIFLSAETTWTITNLIVEGKFYRIFQTDCKCSIDGLKWNINTSLSNSNGINICSAFSGTVAKNIQIFVFNYQNTSESIKVCPFFNTLSTNSILEKSFVNGDFNCSNFYLVEELYPGSYIKNCYFKGNLYSLSGSFENPNFGIFCRKYGSASTPTRTVENNFALIYNLKLNLTEIALSGDFFNDYGYNDWYIPSKDEIDLIYNNKSNILFSSIIQNWVTGIFYPMSSSEADSSNYYRKYNASHYTSSKIATDYNSCSSLILVRNLENIPADIDVGEEFESTVVIYKNGTSGIGAAKTPVMGGYKVFKWNNITGLLDTGTAVGTGKSNTDKILASTTDNQSGVNWRDFTFLLQAPELNLSINDPTNITLENNYFHIVNKHESINLKSTINQDESKTLLELYDQNTFQNWDFINVWNAPSSGILPSLISNLPYSYETYSIAIFNLLRIDDNASDYSHTFSFVLKKFAIPNELVSGIDIYDGETLVYNSTLENHTVILEDDRDYNLLLKPYVIIDSEKVYQTQNFIAYYHYYRDQLVPDVIDVFNDNLIIDISKDGDLSAFIHGSIIYDGYIYGSTRNPYDGNGNHAGNGSFVRIPIDNYHNYEILNIIAGNYTDTILWQMESIAIIGKYLFSIATIQPFNQPEICAPNGFYLIMIDTDTFSYKLFRIPNYFPTKAEPILSDGIYLFISTIRYTWKIDPSIYINAPNQFYIENNELIQIPTWNTDGWFYDSNTQGGHIDFPQTDYNYEDKGGIHSGVIDSEYIFLSYVTDANSGYRPDLNINGIHELHVVKKSNMSAAGWSYIPKSTDDMCQTIDWLFFGIEVQSNANINTYGYGWGLYGIKKNEIIYINHSGGYVDVVKKLPKLHETDNPPTVQSYASLIFGNYLLDFKTNKYVYIIDKSDADNWSISENIGERLLKIIKFKINGSLTYNGIPNEAMLDESGNFHSFLWKNPSGAFKFLIPELSFFLEPSIQTLTALINGSSAIMRGYILNENGQAITERGFEYGTNNDPETWTDSVESDDTTNEFTKTLNNLENGSYYYRAYAINSIGTGYGSVSQFLIQDGVVFGFFSGDTISQMFLGEIPISQIL